MTTVMDALRNAQFNLQTLGKAGAKSNPIFAIALEQLTNAIQSIEDGKSVDDEVSTESGE